jgi:hypothetical protein
LRKSFGNESTIQGTNRTQFAVINDGHSNHLDIRIDVITNLEAVRTNTRLPYGRSNFSVAEREFYKVPGSGFYEQGLEFFYGLKIRCFCMVFVISSNIFLRFAGPRPGIPVKISKTLQFWERMTIHIDPPENVNSY